MYIFRADGKMERMPDDMSIEDIRKQARKLNKDGSIDLEDIKRRKAELEKEIKKLEEGGDVKEEAEQKKDSVPNESGPASCPAHPEYKGLRLGAVRKRCSGCVNFYNANRAAGVKEKR